MFGSLTPQTKAGTNSNRAGHRRERLLLALILAVGIGLRFYGLYWGYPVPLHCDENSTLGTAVQMGRQFLETGSLRPRGSLYGALPFYVLLLALAPMIGISKLLGLSVDVSALSLVVGRTISALADSAAILVVYSLGRRAFGKRGGLIAAAFYATALLPVREAHFFTVDPLATLLLLIFVVLCLRLSQQPSLKSYIWCGVGLGVALSAKTSVLPLLALPVIIWLVGLRSSTVASRDQTSVARTRLAAAGLIVIGFLPMLVWGQFRGQAQALAERQLLGPTPTHPIASEHAPIFWEQQISATLAAADQTTRNVAGLLVGLGLAAILVTLSRHGQQIAAAAWRGKGTIIGCLATAMGVFILLNPYAVLSPAHYWLPTDSWKITWNILNATGAYRELPFAWNFQFVGTKPYLYQLSHIYPYAVGQPLMIAALLSVVYWTWRLIRGQAGPGWPLVVALLLLLAAMGNVWMKMTRYILPQIPLMCLLAAGMLATLLGAKPRYLRGLGYAMLLGVLLASAAWCLAYLNIYAHRDNRLAAVDYIRGHTASDSRILVEEDDAWGVIGLTLWKSLPQAAVRIYAPYIIEHDYYGQPLPADKREEKDQYLQNHLRWADYLVLTDLRRERIRDLGEQFPVITRFYNELFNGQLDWQLVAEFSTGPALLGMGFSDAGSEPTFRLFDHPRVYVFAKQR